mmetsp:Transcript_21646/g.24154  ORF Transcript_21646/g.24154 Transcript_21646/m.24154 type:complete len:250 (+) Transcript_21646:56-805(+)
MQTSYSRLIFGLLATVFVVLALNFLWPTPGKQPNKTALCETKTDRKNIVDSKGYICDWKDLNYTTNCCPKKPIQFSCESCDPTVRCCKTYSNCVACCLTPDNHLRTTTIARLPTKIKETLEHRASKFKYCSSLCQTASVSVLLEHKFKSHLKHCYGAQGPPLDEVPTETVQDESTEDEDMALTPLAPSSFNNPQGQQRQLEEDDNNTEKDEQIVFKPGLSSASSTRRNYVMTLLYTVAAIVMSWYFFVG